MRHRRPRGVTAPIASLAVAALVLSVLVVGSSTAVAADRPDSEGAEACDVLAAATADEAGELARECNSRVEVLEERASGLQASPQPVIVSHQTCSGSGI